MLPFIIIGVLVGLIIIIIIVFVIVYMSKKDKKKVDPSPESRQEEKSEFIFLRKHTLDIHSNFFTIW